MKLKLLTRLLLFSIVLVTLQPIPSIDHDENKGDVTLLNFSTNQRTQSLPFGHSFFKSTSENSLTKEEKDQLILAFPATCFAPGTDPAVIENYHSIQYNLVNSLGKSWFKYNIASRWSQTALSGAGLVQGEETTLTWSYVPDGTPIGNGGCGVPGESTDNSNFIAFFNGIYGGPTVPGDFTTAPWHSVFVSMFDSWTAVSGLTFVYEPNDDGATVVTGGSGVSGVRGDFRISGHPLDGNSGVLACNYFPDNGDMIIDTSDNYYSTNPGLGTTNVLTHEIGHGLGIQHVCPINQTKLMEPFVTLAFQGPQEDDVLATNRMYGDPEGENDTAANATALGSSPNPVSYSKLQRSIDDENDFDYYSFTISETSTATITLTPTGTTYLDGIQLNTGACTAGSNFDALTVADLMFDVLDTDGSSIIDSGNSTGAGSVETNIVGLAAAGTYYVRVQQQNSINNVQMYNLEVDLNSGTCTNPVVPTNLMASSITGTSALISWDAQTNVLFDLRYREVGSSTWIDIFDLTAPSTTLNGLSTLTQYEVQVRAKCSGNTPTAYSSSLLFTTLDPPPVYCDAGATDTSFSDISRVVFNTIDNTSGFSGYTDFTNLSTDVSAGQYTFTALSDGNSLFEGDQVLVWIDFNQDGDFEDSGEDVLITTPVTAANVGTTYPFGGSITIPVGALAGNTRMRVRIHNTIFGTPNPNPCGDSGVGEVEDYTVNILIVCNIPTNLVASNIGISSVDLSWDMEPSATDGYDIVFISDGSTPDGSTTPDLTVSSGTLSETYLGLNPSTNYNAYIRSRCSGSTFSDWSSAANFTTLDCLDHVYNGNGNTGFSGPVGQSSLSFEDDGTTITGTFIKGAANFDDAMVIYISTGAAGRNLIDINVNDEGDPLRRAISQAGTDGSVVTFPAGFEANYAIAIDDGFGGLWSIPTTGAIGNNGLPFIDGVGNPTSNTQASFTFSFDWTEIGLTNKDEFDFVITYLNSNNGFSSNEGYGAGLPGTNPGTNDFAFTSSESYPFYHYVFDGTSWSPSDPDGVNESCRRALIQSGSPTFTNVTTLEAVRIEPQGVLDIDANLLADLIFKSDASGSGQLDNSSGATVSGNAFIERFIPVATDNSRAFRFLSSPISSTNSIFDNWQESGASPDGFGTHITGSTSGANGFDATQTGNPSLFYWNNAAQGYDSAANTNATNLSAGTPYTLFVRGDRNYNLNSNPQDAPNTDTTLRSEGTLNFSNFSASLSTANNSISLVGNPLQAILNFNGLSFGGDVNSNFMTVFNPDNGPFGDFEELEQGIDDANMMVQPSQSFFIQNNASVVSTPTLEFTLSAINTSGMVTSVFNDSDLSLLSLGIYTNNEKRDELKLRFEDGGNNAQDNRDALKYFGQSENLWTEINALSFAIERRAIPQDEEVISLNIGGYLDTAYELRIDHTNWDNNIEVLLIDNYLNTSTLINPSQPYNFTIDQSIPESIAQDRFSLSFDNTTLGTSDNDFVTNFSLIPNPTSGKFTIHTPGLNGDVQVEITNVIGQIVQTQNLEITGNKVNVDAQGLADGMYLVKLSQQDLSYTAKLIVQ